MTAYDLRDPDDRDWPAIKRLADVAVSNADDAPSQEAWVRARRGFAGVRRHHVAVLGNDVVGYGAVERRAQDPQDSFRAFVVTDWVNTPAVADALYTELEADLIDVRARDVWLREYASDAALLEFFMRRGFQITDEYVHEGASLVNLSKHLQADR